MINIDNVEKFVTEELAQGEHFSLRKEGWIELITRLRQAGKDAARYRWLRDVASSLEIRAPLVFMADEFGTSERVIDGPELDKRIDEAMQCEQ